MGCTYQYHQADKYFIINDDPDLFPLKVPWPKCPPLHTIDGYGLPPEDQVFVRQEYPKKLIELEAKVRLQQQSAEKRNNKKTTTRTIIKGFWDELTQRQSEFRNEIAWIKTQWNRRRYGYWCFVNGKPIYHLGNYYMYINFWMLEENLKPEYRQIDNQAWYFKKWAAYYKVNDRRIFAGTIQTKIRRAGETSMEMLDNLLYVTDRPGVSAYIQSFSEDAAKGQWITKFLPSYQKYPIIFKPLWEGDESPKTEMSFGNPWNEYMKDPLNSLYKYATTESDTFFDNKKIGKYHGEEYGKHKDDVGKKWGKLFPCMAPGMGSNITGEASFPTTVNDIDEGGGSFFNMCRNSIWDGSDKGTTTNLVVFFIPSYKRLEGYFDKYGICDEVRAKEHILNTLAELLKDETPEGKTKYLQECRQYPLQYADSFRFSGAESGWDSIKIDEAYQRLKKHTPPDLRRGDYLIEIDNKLYTSAEYISQGWHKEKNPNTDGYGREGRIVWNTNTANGRWYSSLPLEPGATNHKQIILNEHGQHFHPLNYDFATLGADAFEFADKGQKGKREATKRLSNGGGAIFLNFDKKIDGGKQVTDYITNRFIGDYDCGLDDIDEYCEDMLWACIYNNATCFPESNKKSILKHFQERGYWGYLKYEYNTIKKCWADAPGYWLGGKNVKTASHDELAKFMQEYIKYHFWKEKHFRLVEKIKNMGGMENLGKNDLIAAALGALKGANAPKYSLFEDQSKNINTGEVALFPKKRY